MRLRDEISLRIASLETLRELSWIFRSAGEETDIALVSHPLNSRRKDVFAMADWLAAELENLGATIEKRPLGKQMLDGVELDLPPALLGVLGNDPKKVCFGAR